MGTIINRRAKFTESIKELDQNSIYINIEIKMNSVNINSFIDTLEYNIRVGYYTNYKFYNKDRCSVKERIGAKGLVIKCLEKDKDTILYLIDCLKEMFNIGTNELDITVNNKDPWSHFVDNYILRFYLENGTLVDYFREDLSKLSMFNKIKKEASRKYTGSVCVKMSIY